MVFAYVDSAHAAHCGRFFRRHGWEVHLVADGSQVHRLVECVGPSVLVVDTALIEDAGLQAWRPWLLEQGGLKVILMASECTSETRRLQEAIFATALFARDDAIESLGAALLGEPLAEAV
ncbi:MAG: hypothetical protein HY040_22030 [Planctomycetes bacterium]|nr:hypothetical protein [Planctomycetota bacterium]